MNKKYGLVVAKLVPSSSVLCVTELFSCVVLLKTGCLNKLALSTKRINFRFPFLRSADIVVCISFSLFNADQNQSSVVALTFILLVGWYGSDCYKKIQVKTSSILVANLRALVLRALEKYFTNQILVT